MTVASDDGKLLAAWLRVGTVCYAPLFTDRATAADEFARGDVKWSLRPWNTHNVLTLTREGDPYSAQAFWNAESGRFVAWYINLQEPMRRSPLGFDTRDQSLDIVIGPDNKTWMWKDVEETARGVELGLFTPEEAEEVRRNGEAVIELVESGTTWWEDWRNSSPDPSWPLPTLPEGWDA